MFTKIPRTADSQISNEDVASLIVGDALNKISQLTGLNHQKAFTLLSTQVSLHTGYSNHKETVKVEAPLLEHSEFLYISNLFN